jgi:carboxyl-terminal processing protease
MRSKFEKFGLIAVGLVLGVMLSLNISAIADKDTKPQLPLEDLRAFAEVFGKIKSDYVEPVEDKKLISEAINGMLTGLDPHSSYLDVDGFKDLQAGTQGEFGGLGIEVSMEDGLVKVVSPIEDTPAYKAGVKPGDLIFKLDDAMVKGMSLNDAVKKMRGKPDTPIVLTILRKGEANPLIIKIVRAVIKTKSIKPKLVEPGFGYVRVTQFQEHTGEDLAKALKDLHEENKGNFKGFVLDLRNDPGGLLNGAVGVAAAFLAKDALVVYTEGRTADAKMRLTANAENYVRGGAKNDYLRNLSPDYKKVPMVVLINGGSASASEIVAGALQDHKRATVLGTQSFGKGSVQTILPMNNGTAIKLTTARYYTPNGRSIQATGIVPDIIIEDGSEVGFSLREADLTRHLVNPKESETPAAKPAEPAKEVEPAKKDEKPAEKTPPIEYGSKDDIQLTQALNLLKGIKVTPSKPSVTTDPAVPAIPVKPAAPAK